MVYNHKTDLDSDFFFFLFPFEILLAFPIWMEILSRS